MGRLPAGGRQGSDFEEGQPVGAGVVAGDAEDGPELGGGEPEGSGVASLLSSRGGSRSFVAR